ncbi:non-ribosomal peptide synthetase [Synechococcus sp. PCC 7336]|uniref:non-ribosomal peptide synthetase n=1 Tax=Synechococcus sp. PCC 7336 TaxID=195250 RepID=UPI00034D47E4|nr:non-ribosomal peptide synthetase [Synechococcus sp. PCC 7336]
MPDRTVENIYELSPMQQGMLFHTLASPQSGVYVQQYSWTLQGELRLSVLQQAWQQVVDRHAILRTSFHWDNLEKPYQVVYEQVELPFEHRDLSQMPAGEQAEARQEILAADRSRGFELTAAPLMRVTILQLDRDRFQVVWCYHHILLDGWSLATLYKEVMLCYEAQLRQKTLQLPPPPRFRDYINWLQQQDLDKAETYWRQTLAGFREAIALDLDRRATLTSANSHSAEKNRAESAKFRAVLDSAPSDKLVQLSRQYQLTLNTIAQGAWALLLSCYTGETDIVYGTASSGRPPEIPNVNAIVGLFLSTLPVRVRIDPDAPLVDWLQSLQIQQAESRQYEYTPLSRIQSYSELPPSTPLFDSLLVFSNTPSESASSSPTGSLALVERDEFEKTNYPITVLISPGTNLTVELLYDRERVNGDSAKQLLEHYRTLLAEIAIAPHCPLSEITPAAPDRAQQTLWNQTAADYPDRLCLPDLFADRAQRTPEAIAVSYKDERITYAELERRSGQLASYLQQLGVGPDVSVGLCVDRSLDLPIGLLAILKAGGTCVPLDPSYPLERLRIICSDARLSAIVSQEHLRDRLPETSAQILCLDRWEPFDTDSSDRPAAPQLYPDNLAYLLYTSGSTGRPKGVAMTHRAIVNLVHWQRSQSTSEAASRTLQFTSLNFDVSFQEIFSTWYAGGTLILVSDSIRRDIPQLLRHLDDWQVTRLFLPFVALRQLAEVAIEQAAFPAHLRQVIAAGEQLQAIPQLETFFSSLNDCSLHNQYGPSETHVATAEALSDAPSEWPILPPIGRPIANTSIDLLDAKLQPVATGLPGEIYIGGVQLARGYLNRPDLTAASFIPNPFSDRPGDRLYKTGDLARYLPDGRIEYLGRIDTCVKLRGYRIELGEIEVVLAQAPSVKAAIVAVHTNAAGDRRLVAYIIPTEPEVASAATLKQFLQERLPDYMLPSAFVIQDSFPLTPSGKVDRRALQPPSSDRLDLATTYTAPRTPTEELLASLWAEVLAVERVGIHDNFFDLGGHSLLAIRLVSRIQTALGRPLPLLKLFEFSTIAELAAFIDRDRQTASGQELLPLVPVEHAEERPLSPTQKRLWFFTQQVSPDHYFYNTATGRHITGPLDIPVLKQCLATIQQRHDSIRTRFRTEGDRVIKTVPPDLPVNLLVVDISDLPKSLRAAETERLATLEFRQPFDLASGPLLRTSIIWEHPEQSIALFTCHQLAFDAWSRNVFMRELELLYPAIASGRPSPLPPLTIQYDDFVEWQQKRSDSGALQASQAYWQGQLAPPLPILDLPTDYPRPAIKSFRGDIQLLRIPSGLAERCRHLSQQEGVTLYMTLLASYSIWLYAYSQQEDAIVGTSVADRRHTEVESSIGSFNNYLALRLDLSGNPTFKEYLGRIRQLALSAYAHQDMPFDLLVESLHIEPDLSRTPIYQAAFAYKRYPDNPKTRSSNLEFRSYPVNWGTARCDLTLSLLDSGDEIVGFLEYSADLFTSDTIVEMLRHALVILEAIATDPDRRLSELPLDPGTELLDYPTPKQEHYLKAFTRRHTQRTEQSKQLATTARPLVADRRYRNGFHPRLKEMVYPIAVDRAEGACLWDVDGNEYLDLTMSYGVTLLGHNPPCVKAALLEQIERGFPLGPPTPLAAEVAQTIQTLTGSERVSFAGTRTEAFIAAIRLARARTQRAKIALFAGSYHGTADTTLARPHSLNLNPQGLPGTAGIPASSVADVLVLDYGNPRSLEIVEARAAELAAVLVEPVQSQIADRLDLQPKGFLQQLRHLTRERNIALILDEVVFGFRIHPGGCQAWFEVDADLAVYGKPAGGGLPLGIVAGKAEYLDAIDGGSWQYGDDSAPQVPPAEFGSTYSTHPLAMASTRAVLQAIQRRGPQLQSQLNQRTDQFVDRLNAEFSTERVPLQLKHFGSRFGLVSIGGALAGGSANVFRYHLLERGVYLQADCGSFSSAHTDADIEAIAAAFRDSARAMRSGGLLPD